jgi:hypothetical protein
MQAGLMDDFPSLGENQLITGPSHDTWTTFDAKKDQQDRPVQTLVTSQP